MSVEADGRHLLELLSPADYYCLLKKTIQDYLVARLTGGSNRVISYEHHDGHGLYYEVDVLIGGKRRKFMIDPTPEEKDDPRRDERGYIVVRPESHAYWAPARIGSLNILADEDAVRQLDILLGLDDGA